MCTFGTSILIYTTGQRLAFGSLLPGYLQISPSRGCIIAAKDEAVASPQKTRRDIAAMEGHKG
jgi:hypothetical protein